MPQGFYDEEEADAILRLAAQKPMVGGMSRERLLATAAELGISEQAVAEAEQTLHKGSKKPTCALNSMLTKSVSSELS